MRQVFEILSLLIQSLSLILLGWQVLYLFIFALAGLFYKAPELKANPLIRKIAVLIPGYREDSVIIDVAKQAILQDYPSKMFDVIIIADSFQPATLSALKALPVKLIVVVFQSSTKAKALKRAMQKLDSSYDIVLVLDADNIMEKEFLRKINSAFEDKFLVVQGHRKAANQGTNLAVLDGISEEINNHIFRKGHRVLGLSSAIIGSGMAFQTDFFRKLISEATAVGGFDKEMELNLLKNRFVIQYLDNAVVYDEKVSHGDDFTNQRRRWLSAQFYYFRRDLVPAIAELFKKGNIDYFDKVIQFILLPRILLLGAISVLTAFFTIVNEYSGMFRGLTVTWLIMMVLYLAVFLFSVPSSFYTRRTMRAVAGIPKGMWLMMISLSRIKGANRNFIHTRHGTTIKSKT